MNYSKKIITYIDYLGFKNEISNKTCEEISIILFLFGAQCGMSLRNTSESATTGTFYKYQFSDSLVRITGVKENENIEDVLLAEVDYLIHNQKNSIIYHDIFIRGGITIGDIYYDYENGKTFGPGFIKAYELEKHAEQPIISVDPDLVGIIREPKITNHNSGNYYLNYLSPENNNPNFAEMDLNKHKDKVSSQYKRFIKNDKIKAKYAWLTDYHNFTVNKYAEWINRSFKTKSTEMQISLA